MGVPEDALWVPPDDVVQRSAEYVKSVDPELWAAIVEREKQHIWDHEMLAQKLFHKVIESKPDLTHAQKASLTGKVLDFLRKENGVVYKRNTEL